MCTSVASGKRVHIFSLRDSKMYTFVSIASSKRVPSEINESGAIDKIRISVENDTVKCLKAFRIISREMPISSLILSL